MLQVSILSKCIIKFKVGKKEITLTQKTGGGKKKIGKLFPLYKSKDAAPASLLKLIRCAFR